MQKILWLFLIASFGATDLMGQLRLGVKADLSLSFNRKQQIFYDDFNDFLLYKLTVLEQDVGMGIGLVGYAENEYLFFQPEITYKQIKTGFLLESFIVDAPYNDRIDKVTSFINVPIKAGVKVDKFKLGVGPIVSFVADDTEVFSSDPRFEEQRDKVEMGFTFNLGMIQNWLHLEISYETRFNGIADYFYFRDTVAGFRGRPGYVHFGFALILK